jgi:fermentation-respiration switch protein FrsA (DUF1100 family)
MMAWGRLAVVWLAALLGGGCVSGLFYHPTADVYRVASQVGTPCEEVWFASADGTRLHGWWLPAQGPAKGTIVHLHGNAQNLTAHAAYVLWLPREGYHVLTFDYRGYGQSAGEPDRHGLFLDAAAAIAYARGRPDATPDRLVVYGQSLGAANALAVVGETRPTGVRAVIAEAPFASYRGIVRDKLRQLWLLRPLRWPLSWVLLSDRHSPAPAVGRIAPVPLLLIHGTADEVIPVHHSERLFAAAGEPKTLWLIPDGHHADAMFRDGKAHRQRLLAWLDAALGPQESP